MSKRKYIKSIFTDDRGKIYDIFVREPKDHCALVTFNKDSVRGNHFHKKSIQSAFILDGIFKIYETKVDNNLDYFNSFFLSYINHDQYPWIKKAWIEHTKNILEFKKISDDIGADFLFVFWGDLPDYSASIFQEAIKDNLPISLSNNEKKLFSFLKEHNINYLNLSKLAWNYVGYNSLIDKGEKLRDVLIWKNDNHLNIKGNQFMYEQIYSKLSLDNIIN